MSDAYSVNCDPVTGLCTATLKVSTRGAYPIPSERVSPILAERLKSAGHDTKTDGPEYLGFGYKISLKDIDEPKRRIPFVASTPLVDRYGDVIEQDGWDLTFYRKNPVCLWGHDSRALPIAKSVSCSVVEGKLVNIMEFATADVYDFADRVFRMILGGFISTTSVGFIPLSFEWLMDDPDPETGYQRITGRRYTKSELLEVSVVNVPANPECLVVGRGFEAALRAFEQDDSVTPLPKIADSQSSGGTSGETFAEPCQRSHFVIHANLGVSRSGTASPFDHKEIEDAPLFAFVPDKGHARFLDFTDEDEAEAHAVKTYNDGFFCELIGADVEDDPVYRSVLRIAKSDATEMEPLVAATKKTGKRTQTVIFSKKYWTEPRAKKWASAHSLKTSDPQHTDTSWRFRQFAPSECVSGSYETLTENLPKGLSLGVCNKKEKSGEAAEQKTNMPCQCGKSNNAADKGGAAGNGAVEEKAVVPFHHYPLAPSDAPWDAGKEMGSTDKPEDWRKMSTIVLNDGKNKGDFKLPHHKGPGGKFATVRRGVANALARANQVKGASAADKAGARKHLMKHMAEFHKDDGKEFNEVRFLEELRTFDMFVDAMPENVREAAMKEVEEHILGEETSASFRFAAHVFSDSRKELKDALVETWVKILEGRIAERGFTDAKLQKKMAKVHKFLNSARDYMEEMYKDVGDSMGQACDLADDVNGAFPPSKEASAENKDTQDGDQPEPAATTVGDSTVADKLRAMRGHAKAARRSAYRSFGLMRESILGAIENLEDLCEAMSDADDGDGDDPEDDPSSDSPDSGVDPSGESAADAGVDGPSPEAVSDAIAAQATRLLEEASKSLAGAPPASGTPTGQEAATEASSVDEVESLIRALSEGMRQEASS